MIFRRRPGDPRVVLVEPLTREDSYGDVVEDWAAPTRTLLPRAQVQDRDSVEAPGPGRQRISSTRVVYVEGDYGLLAGARLEIDGESWQVDGRPAVKRGFSRNVYTAFEVVRPTG